MENTSLSEPWFNRKITFDRQYDKRLSGSRVELKQIIPRGGRFREVFAVMGYDSELPVRVICKIEDRRQ